MMARSKYGDDAFGKILEEHDRLLAAKMLRQAADIIASYDADEFSWTPENVKARLELYARRVEKEGLGDAD